MCHWSDGLPANEIYTAIIHLRPIPEKITNDTGFDLIKKNPNGYNLEKGIQLHIFYILNANRNLSHPGISAYQPILYS